MENNGLECERVGDDREGDDFLAYDSFLFVTRRLDEALVPDGLTDKGGATLTSLVGELMRNLPRQLHDYRPLVIRAVRQVVPPQCAASGASDAVRFLGDAYENWRRQGNRYNPRQFSAYAKKCVYGRLRNEYVRSVRPALDADDPAAQGDRERAERELRQAQTFLKMLGPALEKRPELLRRLQKNSSRKDLSRDLRRIRHTIFVLLPDVEQHVIIQRTEGEQGRILAERLGVSPGRVTQIQQQGVERALEYMADLLEGVSRKELACRTARMEITLDARVALRTDREIDVLVRIRTDQVLGTEFVRWNPQTRRLERVRHLYDSGLYRSRAFPDIFRPKCPRYRPLNENSLRDHAAEADDYYDWQADKWEEREVLEAYYSNLPT